MAVPTSDDRYTEHPMAVLGHVLLVVGVFCATMAALAAVFGSWG